MLHKLVPKSDFSKNVVTLLTGTTVAQAIPIAISPILTRLYTPEEFGLLAIFLSITVIFGAIANGRYELAIMLPDSDDDAYSVAGLSLYITTFLSILLLFFALAFNLELSVALGSDDIKVWLYWVPLSVFLIGLFNALSYLNNRMGNYKSIAKAGVFKSLLLSFIQVSVGTLRSGSAGLIIGQVFSHLAANISLAKSISRAKLIQSFKQPKKIIRVAIRYQNFPKYSMFAILANSLSINFVNLLISSFYSVTTLGFYSLVQRILGAPSVLLGGAVGKVFFKSATREKKETGLAIKSYNEAFIKLFFVSLPTFIGLYFFVEDLFILLFGMQWALAGKYAQILIPLFAIRFIAASLSCINSVFEKQKLSLYWQLVLLTLSLGVVYFSQRYSWNFEYYLTVMSFTIGVHYVLLLILQYFVSRGKI